MKEWNFKVFISLNGDNEILNWIDGLPINLQARIKRIVAYLETQKDMRSSYFKKYKGHDNIYELRFTANNIQYRPLGCFGPGTNEFTLLIPAIEKGNKLIPKDAAIKAEERCKLIYRDRRYTNDFV